MPFSTPATWKEKAVSAMRSFRCVAQRWKLALLRVTQEIRMALSGLVGPKIPAVASSGCFSLSVARSGAAA